MRAVYTRRGETFAHVPRNNIYRRVYVTFNPGTGCERGWPAVGQTGETTISWSPFRSACCGGRNRRRRE